MAFSIFGIAVTSLVVALHSTAELGQKVIHAQWLKQEAQNILSEVVTTPAGANGIERDETIIIDEFTEARVLVEPHEAVDKDDNNLEDLYSIKVTIIWDEDGTRSEETFSTIHYAHMFATQ